MKDSVGDVQSALVLGGGSEIGLATARALAGRRARTVALAARRPAELAGAVADLRSSGATRVETLALDATDFAGHAAFVDEAWRLLGEVDLVLFAFGVLGDQDRDEHDAAAALEVLQTNYAGAVSLAIPIADRLRAQGHGTMVLLSSVAGERARRSNFVYGSSKAGVDAFFQGLDDALVGSGVDVMIVRPGFVRTKMTTGLEPAPLAVTADDVAGAILRGLERGDHVVWVPSALRFVMSGLRHLPRPVFRRLPL